MPNLSYESSVTINAPASAVYVYVADLRRHVEWNHAPQKMVAITEGPVQVGSQFQTHEQTSSNATFKQKLMFGVALPMMKLMYGVQDYTVAEVTTLEPNKRVAWKARLPSTKKGDLMRMFWEIELEPQGEAATRLTQRCLVAPPEGSPMQSFINDDLMKQSQAEVTLNLQQLKMIVEKQPVKSADFS